MPALIKTTIGGTIQSLLIHPDNSADITSVDVSSVNVSFAGFEGESHSGLTRESCVRVAKQYPKGTVIRNTRQVSIVSTEELVQIAELMDIEKINPAWLGANLCLSGIPELTLLPPSTRLIFSNGVSLVVDMENEPCQFPAQIIDKFYPGQGKLFVRQAKEKRGVTAWVERQGILNVGEAVIAHMPKQRLYRHS